MKKIFLVFIISFFGPFTTQAATKVMLVHTMDSELTEKFNQIIQDFNSSQSDVIVESSYTSLPNSMLHASQLTYQAYKGPQVIQIQDIDAALLVQANPNTLSFEDLMNTYSENWDKKDFSQIINSFYNNKNGKMVGVSFTSSTPVLFYNKEAFQRAGLTLPPATWEDFEMRVAPALKKVGYIAFSQSNAPAFLAESFHARHNIQMASNNNGYNQMYTKTLFNNPQLKIHLNKLLEWQEKGYYGYYGQTWNVNRQVFINQHVAMWIGASDSLQDLKDQAKFEFGVTFLPYWHNVSTSPTNTFANGSAFFVRKYLSEEQNKAIAKFFEYFYKPEIQHLWQQKTGFMPATYSGYKFAKSSGYYKDLPDAEISILQINLSKGVFSKGFQIYSYRTLREVIFEEFNNLLKDEQSLSNTLFNIDKASKRISSKFGN